MPRIYDLTAPLCIRDGRVEIPKPKSAQIDVKIVGHDLVLSGMRVYKYLSNIMCFDFHTGTHFDIPPVLAYRSGKPPTRLEFFIREAVVVDVEGNPEDRPIGLQAVKSQVDEEEFRGRPEAARPALILRTGFSRYWCRDNTRYMRFPGLSQELVNYIAYKLEPPFIGIDAISVDKGVEYRSLSLYPEIDEEFVSLLKDQEPIPFLNHDTLLRKNILILENLYLQDLPREAKRGLLLALPLFRYRAESPGDDFLFTAIPARVVMLSPPPGLEDVLEQLGLLEKMVSSMIGA